MVKPWADAGYQCVCVDIQHKGTTTHGNITLVGADVCSYLPPRTDYKIVFAFPPCTDVAISGARHFATKGLGKLADALRIVDACNRICEWSDAPYMIENPVSTISTYWRKPDHKFNPCDYAGYDAPEDAYTKKTCLWTGNGFVLPPKKPLEVTRHKLIVNAPDSKGRADKRSVTPMGFARAVYEANK